MLNTLVRLFSLAEGTLCACWLKLQVKLKKNERMKNKNQLRNQGVAQFVFHKEKKNEKNKKIKKIVA